MLNNGSSHKPDTCIEIAHRATNIEYCIPWANRPLWTAVTNYSGCDVKCVRVTSHERHGGKIHYQFDCSFKLLFRRIVMKPSHLLITLKPAATCGFPTKRVSNAETVPIPWCHHGPTWWRQMRCMCQWKWTILIMAFWHKRDQRWLFTNTRTYPVRNKKWNDWKGASVKHIQN